MVPTTPGFDTPQDSGADLVHAVSEAPVARWPRKWASRFVAAICVLGILAGIGFRVYIYVQNDPMGVSGDLVSIQYAWDEMSGKPASARPSVRLDQFTYASLLGLLREQFGFPFALGAELASLMSGIGLIGAMALMGYGLTGRATTALVFALFTALHAPLIRTTARAESESPFYFTTMLAWALAVMYWRRKNPLYLLAALPLFIASAGTRGTGVLHIGALCTAMVAIHLTTRRRDRRAWISLVAILVIGALSIGVATYLKQFVHDRVERAYIEKTGKPPAFRGYTTYVLFDGLIAGPFPFVPGNDGWARRQKAVKGVDPDTGKPFKNPSTMDGSALDVIRSDPQRYARNFIVGVYETCRRFALNPIFNFLGPVMLLLGTLYIVWRRDWLSVFIIGAWVAVYAFLVPLIFAHDRTVLPASLALCMPGLLMVSSICRGLFVGRLQRHGAAFWLGTVLCLSVIAYTANSARDMARRMHYTDVSIAASKNIQATGAEQPLVLSATSGIVAFGQPMRIAQMKFDATVEVQRAHLLERRPDYLYLSNSYRKEWSDKFNTLTDLLSSGQEAFKGERIFEQKGTEVWRIVYTDTPPPPPSAAPVPEAPAAAAADEPAPNAAPPAETESPPTAPLP